MKKIITLLEEAELIYIHNCPIGVYMPEHFIRVRIKINEALEEAKIIAAAHVNFWQACPKCDGAGTMSKPPYVAGDIKHWGAGSTMEYECNVCKGKKIISTQTGLPPQ